MNDSMLFRQLLDTLTDGIFFKDTKGKYLRVNPAWASWHGFANPDDVVGKSDEDFYPKEFARATGEIESALVKSGIPILEQEEKVAGRDRKTRWVLTTKVPLRNSKDRVTGILGISRDIGGIKRAEAKTKDSEALYRSLIEALPQCIFRKDFDGRYEYVNQHLCDLVGLTPKDFIGKTDFDTNPKALASKYRRDDQWVMTHERVFEAVEEFKTKHKKIEIRVFKTPVYDATGRVVGVQGVFTPLTGPLPGTSGSSK